MKTIRLCTVSLSLIIALALGGNSLAQANEADLLKEAKISKSDAEKKALGQVANGAIKSGELEREHGALVWSFDISQPGKRDIKEVQVDAKTGKIVSVETETPKDQAKEDRTDKKK